MGPNNSGKSGLLEAIHLLTGHEAVQNFIDIQRKRGEFVSDSPGLYRERDVGGEHHVSHLFHGRQFEKGQFIRIESRADKRESLKIRVGETEMDQRPSLFGGGKDDIDDASRQEVLVFEHSGTDGELFKEHLLVSEDGFVLSPEKDGEKFIPTGQSSRFVTPSIFKYNELARLWDNITLTPGEEKVIEALQIFEPGVERISFTSSQTPPMAFS